MDMLFAIIGFGCFIGIIYLIITRKRTREHFKVKLVILIIAFLFSVGESSSISDNNNFEQAMTYYNNKQYSKALESFKEISDSSSKYSDAKSKISKINLIIHSSDNYSKGLGLMNEKKYEGAIDLFKKVDETSDKYSKAQEYIAKCASLDKEKKAKEATLLANKKLEEQKAAAIKKAAEEKAAKEAEIKAQEEEAKAQQQAEEKAAQDIVNYKNSCKSFLYSDIARNPDSYKGENIKFSGKVVQVMEDGDDLQLRVDVSQEDLGNDIILVNYTRPADESRILEDDNITLYGVSDGLCTYESTLGGNITIPQVNAKYIDNNQQ